MKKTSVWNESRPYYLEAYQYDRGWVRVETAPTLAHAMTWVCVNAHACDCGHRVVHLSGEIIAKGSYQQLCTARTELLASRTKAVTAVEDYNDLTFVSFVRSNRRSVYHRPSLASRFRLNRLMANLHTAKQMKPRRENEHVWRYQIIR